MSGLYIPNMNYPKVGEVICVFPNGKVQKRIVELSALYEVVETNEAIHVPDHGRLIEDTVAIETVWLILRGLGYFKEENPQLELPKSKVFQLPPIVFVEEGEDDV